ncbi:hypothetical protein HJB88_06575 [Rhizobium sp. NZLR5]|uniref:hypothetical protein n=1 Tax=Rhizobium sp. NZLR5 TaxID=2731103 RepID=UPI001C828806|nr:hypothetical protein [Rhizobium sp. NZLR5]MBX5182308.1 hypothetical protein [Rhizobium sp. NZLR5]
MRHYSLMTHCSNFGKVSPEKRASTQMPKKQSNAALLGFSIQQTDVDSPIFLARCRLRKRSVSAKRPDALDRDLFEDQECQILWAEGRFIGHQ